MKCCALAQSELGWVNLIKIKFTLNTPRFQNAREVTNGTYTVEKLAEAAIPHFRHDAAEVCRLVVCRLPHLLSDVGQHGIHQLLPRVEVAENDGHTCHNTAQISRQIDSCGTVHIDKSFNSVIIGKCERLTGTSK